MIFGYARVSKPEGQDTSLQVQALEGAGAERIFEEKLSGGRWDRPELHRLLDHLRPGDLILVWKLDRLSRSLKDLLHIVERIERAGASFRSLTEPVDTSTPAGKMFMSMVGAFAEFERGLVRERTRAGLEAARAKGRIGGRKPKVTPEQRAMIVKLVKSGEKIPAEVARLFGVHPSTISRIISEDGPVDSPAREDMRR